ncbi:hypothetical protein C1H46_011053 [Malus baccata]|uniref:Uncharacterized protein n=1 Tax=Malus baccata TaxID=106549 RepID=A0A540MX27_MALBA|nr:hypothetical protein C1H46_011053 [Malus baccata]
MLNVVVSSSELAKEVLKEHDQKLADRHRSRSAAKFSNDGQDLIWANYGPHYVKVRKVCTLELFSPKRIKALRPIREDEVTAMVESIFKHCANPATTAGLSTASRSFSFLLPFTILAALMRLSLLLMKSSGAAQILTFEGRAMTTRRKARSDGEAHGLHDQISDRLF